MNKTLGNFSKLIPPTLTISITTNPQHWPILQTPIKHAKQTSWYITTKYIHKLSSSSSYYTYTQSQPPPNSSFLFLTSTHSNTAPCQSVRLSKIPCQSVRLSKIYPPTLTLKNSQNRIRKRTSGFMITSTRPQTRPVFQYHSGDRYRSLTQFFSKSNESNSLSKYQHLLVSSRIPSIRTALNIILSFTITVQGMNCLGWIIFLS